MVSWIEVICITLLAAVISYGGYHFGAQSVQVRWDAANSLAASAALKKQAADQLASDTASKMVETEINKRNRLILELNTELTNANNELGPCGKQPLPSDSVRTYRNIAAVK